MYIVTSVYSQGKKVLLRHHKGNMVVNNRLLNPDFWWVVVRGLGCE